jgi:signal transduction histidine kinase
MWNGKNWKTFSSSDGIPAKNINELFCDSQGTIWIGTFGSGIYRYSQDHFDSFTVNDGLPTNSINCFLEDQEGGLFIGLVSGGLNRISNGSVSVLGEKSFNDIWSILEDSNKTLWFTLFSEGVAAIHRNGEWNYLKKQNGLPSNNAKGIYEDLDGSLWIGTIDQGCCRLINGKITEKYSTQNGLINNSVRSFLRDSRGTLWIGTDRGVSCLINGIFHNYGKNEGLSNERAPVLYEDKSSQVWVGTREGLFVFKNNSIVHSYTRANGLTVPDILALREDSNNVFWIGTAEGGIYRLKNGSLVNINVQHGLFDNVIYSLLEDDVGYIWISCNKGIFCVKKSDLDSVADGKLARLRCKIFGTSDGMISAECNGGSQPSAIRSSDGRLWFPTIRGAVTINPKNLYKNEIPPKIILEEIRIDGIIDSVILRQNGIELPSSTEKLEFQYTAICLTAAERVKFKYMLEGFDKEWVEAENRRTAYYTNLPKGRKYRFRVIACNNDGVWNEKGTWIEFSVKPFWWTTSWFYAICIIIICSLVYFSILWRTNRLLKRAEALENIIDTRTQEIQNQAQQIQLKNTELSESLETLRRTQNQLAQAEKMASLGTLVAGVAHELNTPIGVAVTAASTLHGKVQTFENEYKAGGLKKSTLETFIEQAKIGADLTLRNLARAANLIQSFKQVAVDQTSDNKRRFHLHKYLHEVITSLEPKWKATQHRVEITCDENLVLETYPGAIAQIITNLIENSLLHGFSEFTETGIMRISAEQGPQSNRITITYSDTGRGIPSEILPRIFDPFFTTKQAQGGTGLGMHIVYNLVTQKLGGEIHCASEAERGTTFTITLPV